MAERRSPTDQISDAERAAALTAALTGRYVVERELGRGGMATVYLADDVRHRRKVAIKVLKPELAAVMGAERFVQEITTTAALQHPHILPLFDSGEANGLLYYTMPYVEGETLRARIAREHQLPIADVTRIMREMADALAEAHSHGVVHRDIKPDNVLLRGQHAIITDFGIAKAVSEATGVQALTTVGVTLGTPAYMAPEQAVGDSTFDHRADIYALGVMAYEMLTGAPPFTGTTYQAVLTAHMTRQPDPIASRRADVPAPLTAIVMRCLEKQPDDRWQNVNDLLAQLDSVATPGGGLLPLAPRPAGGSRELFTRSRVLALIGVLVAVGVAGYALQTRRSAVAVDHTRPPTVAVLPFENLGAPNDEYFADGMTDEITGRLAKLTGLAVIARTSAIQYKKTTKTIPQIAKELGADFLVEGTVRWEKTADGAGRVRVAPQVIRASDGTNVWSDRFDKPYGTDVFGIQSDIAEQVASAMDVTLNPGDRPVLRQVPTTNLAAYDAYLRALSLSFHNVNAQDWQAQRQALENLEQAVQLDPRFAEAQALLALVHSQMVDDGYDLSLGTGVTKEQRWRMARAAVERALAVDSLSTMAHGVLAFYFRTVVVDTARERTELELAQRSAPSSPETMDARGFWLAGLGRTEEALREFKRAAALDPRNGVHWTSIASVSQSAQDFPAALAALQRAIAIAPTEASLYVWSAWLHVLHDQRDSARAVLREGIARSGVNSLLFRMAQHTVWVDMIRIFHDDLGEPAGRLTWKDFGTDSIDYFEAKARAYEMGSARSRAYFDSIVAWATPQAKLPTGEPFFKLGLAYGLAGAGRRDEAVRALQLMESVGGYSPQGVNIGKAAQACVMMGEFDRAIGYIRRALTDPRAFWYAPAMFRLDPIWQPLRERADFKALIAPR